MSVAQSPTYKSAMTEKILSFNLESSQTTSPNNDAPSSPPKKPITPRKTVTFNDDLQTHTVSYNQSETVSSSLPTSRRYSFPLQPRNNAQSMCRSSLCSSLSALAEQQMGWDAEYNSDQEEEEDQELRKRLVPDDGDMFLFEGGDDLELPESVNPQLSSPPPELEEDVDNTGADDDQEVDVEGKERDSAMHLSHSYLAAIKIPLPPDHPGYEKKPSATHGRSHVAGSVGSYRGKPLVMSVVNDPAIEERARNLGDVNTFVGSINGRSGIDEADIVSYRESLAAGASYMGSLGASLARGKSWVGTPRSFSARPAGVPEKEWITEQRREFLVKRQQERQRERSRNVSKE